MQIRRGTDRFLTRGERHLTRHSFSFGPHYDAENVGFGRLVCHDEHLLASGGGFAEHPHRDVEIVTWVLAGELHHDDSEGHAGVVRPGQVQVLSAGAGVTHSEFAGPSGPTRFVQAWLTPEATGTPPAYSITAATLIPGALSEVARIGDATFWVARLGAGQSLTLPEAPRQHVYVASGALTRSSLAQPLADGDAFRITRSEAGPHPDLTLSAAAATELLVWTFAG